MGVFFSKLAFHKVQKWNYSELGEYEAKYGKGKPERNTKKRRHSSQYSALKEKNSRRETNNFWVSLSSLSLPGMVFSP